MTDFETVLLQRIRALAATQPRVLVAIDGRCAAGKTTLAASLQAQLECNVFHMDDFFLRPEQRTSERLHQPGGNVDYERFLTEVLRPLHDGQAVTYRPYDCHTQQLHAPVRAEVRAVSIIEGSYSCHPALWDLYDLHVFLSVGLEEQRRRIAARSGEKRLPMFTNVWIPMGRHTLRSFGSQSAPTLAGNMESDKCIVKLSATGSKFKVPQVLSRTEIKNLTRPGVHKRQVSF